MEPVRIIVPRSNWTSSIPLIIMSMAECDIMVVDTPEKAELAQRAMARMGRPNLTVEVDPAADAEWPIDIIALYSR